MGIFKNIGGSMGSAGRPGTNSLLKRSWSKKPSVSEPQSEKIAKKADSQREDFIVRKFSHRAPSKIQQDLKINENTPVLKGAFEEKKEYTRNEANQWLADKLHKAECLQLLREILAYDPLRPGETWYQWAERANYRIFGGLDVSAYRDESGVIGYIISKTDDAEKLLQRRNYLQKLIDAESNPEKRRNRERDLKLFDLFVGYLGK